VRRAAAVDIGTNTVLLTIAERRGERVVALVEEARITRLGAGVDHARTLGPEARARTLACLAEYGAIIAAHAVEGVDAVGTSALRDANSEPGFLEEAERALGARPRVISGTEEAELTFHGALSGLALAGEVVVFDVGGGSTEIVHGREGAIRQSASLDVGSVRLFERHVRSDPPSSGEMAAVRGAVRKALSGVAPPTHGATLVGVAGTVTTLACISRQLDIAGAERVHGTLLATREVERLATLLSRLPLAGRLGLAGLDPGRADVIPVGAAMVSELCTWAGARALRVSDRGVRWGLLERILR